MMLAHRCVTPIFRNVMRFPYQTLIAGADAVAIVKFPLVAGVSPADEAVRRFVPDWLTFKSSNVASPEAFVLRVSVPLRTPVPLESDMVTATPAWAMLLLLVSRTWTVTGGEMIVFASAVLGC